MKTSHIYPGAHTLNAYITIKDCSAAIEFYKKAFAAKEGVRLLMPNQKAIDAGATEVMPVTDMFYGDRVGQVMDPFGYKWMITTHQEDVSFEEMQKRSDKMFSGQ